MKGLRNCFVFLNFLFLILSITMIIGPTAAIVIFDTFYQFNKVTGLSILTGRLLFAASIFGIVAAIRESTLLTCVDGIFLIFIFIFQMATAVACFALIRESDEIVHEILDDLMANYRYTNNRNVLNSLQATLTCCGNEHPSDWNNFEYELEYEPYNLYEQITTKSPYPNRMPHSCCTPKSNYENRVCDSHFEYGCHGPLQDILIGGSSVIGCTAIGIGMLQLLGIICAFVLAEAIGRNKNIRVVKKWANHQNIEAYSSVYADQVPTMETQTPNRSN